MPRRSFLIRHVKAPRLAEEMCQKYLLHWNTGDLYHRTDEFPRISSEGLFGYDKPLELEIGCGTGEFLCDLARRDTAANFAGVDFNLKSLHVAVTHAASLGLDNIRFIKASLEYIFPLLVPGSLRAVYLHFPDPALHPKYRKRRFYNESFLDNLYRALAPGGRFSIVTDSRELFFEELLPLVESDPRLRKTHGERYLTGYEPPVKSRYQLYWEGHGATIYRVEVVKCET